MRIKLLFSILLVLFLSLPALADGVNKPKKKKLVKKIASVKKVVKKKRSKVAQEVSISTRCLDKSELVVLVSKPIFSSLKAPMRIIDSTLKAESIIDNKLVVLKKTSRDYQFFEAAFAAINPITIQIAPSVAWGKVVTSTSLVFEKTSWSDQDLEVVRKFLSEYLGRSGYRIIKLEVDCEAPPVIAKTELVN